MLLLKLKEKRGVDIFGRNITQQFPIFQMFVLWMMNQTFTSSKLY